LNANLDLGLDRYLVPFSFRQVPLYRFDVLVVGGGCAGSSAALAAAEQGASVALITKADLQESNTYYAKGGMAAVLSEEDSYDLHIRETLQVGCGLCERAAVERVVRGGPAAVERLVRLGTQFDRAADGALELSREGGHTRPRIVHAHGDATGLEIQRALAEAVSGHPNITTFSGHFAIDVLSASDGGAPPRRALGLLTRSTRGEMVAFGASHTILATGGAGQIYRETTNPAIATGDGVAMGIRAGAIARDLEFFQFHPTCLYIAGAARVLISEVVRGAGGVLRDRDGVRFMTDFHEDAELAPRDVVSRAVFQRMVETADTNVYLDLSGIDTDPHVLFPAISRVCRFFGIDIARDPIPVRPGAHYMIGGLKVDLDGRTSIPNLWAVGECASSGLHGANRMGSNSLLEGVVLGLSAGTAAARDANGLDLAALRNTFTAKYPLPPPGLRLNISDLVYSLKSLMWRQMGVVRDSSGLEDALGKIAFWARAVRDLAMPDTRVWELVNMLTVARLCTFGARARVESRGVHYRSDHPDSRPEWRMHTLITPVFEGEDPRRVQITREPVDTGVTGEQVAV
jgi:L-aspartate oxidase